MLDSLTPREVEVQTLAGAWFLLRIRPYRTLENVIDGAVITFFDITEMKRVREAVQESEAKCRVLFETMSQGVVFHDREGRVIDANPAAERILGWTLDQMKGREATDLCWKAVHEDGADFPEDTHPSMVALKTGQEVRGVIMGVHCPRKEAMTWLRINAMPQFKPGADTPYQVYTSFDDITERLSAEPAGRRERETPPQPPGGAR